MGFLQQDSNSIILDAVLTDKGREFLARNDGSFSVVSFALGDDEVDYSIIQKFGRTIGKEKIEKNTPVFEALTNESIALKHRLVSVSNPNLIRLPSLSLNADAGLSGNTVTIGNSTQKTRQIIISQSIIGDTTINNELRDQTFVVELSNMLLQIVGAVPDTVSSQQRATYTLTRDNSQTSLGGSKLTFTISTKSITDSLFQIYGSVNDKTNIDTYVKVSGLQSGAVYEFKVSIQKTL